MRSVAHSILIGALSLGANFFSFAAVAETPVVTDALPYTADTCCTVCPRASDRDAYISEYMRGYRVVLEGQDGWLFRTDAELLWLEPDDPDLWPAMKRMADALKARGTQVLMFPQPPRALVESRRLDAETLKKYDLADLQRHYSDLVSRLRNAGFMVADGTVFSNTTGVQYFYKRDGHWKPEGAQLAAKMIAEQIKSTGMTFEPKEYKTEKGGLVGARGTMSVVVETLCGIRYPMEYGPAYKTEAAANDDLFGDVVAPEIALVGTSFSGTPTYNFFGFLRDQLKTDILQVAKAGGGFDGALSEYLVSDLYQKNPPKLIIWEFPYQQLQRTNTSVMRRVLPLIGNGCAGKEPALKNTVTLNNGNDMVEAVVNGGPNFSPIPAKDLWIDFQFSDANIRVVKAEVWYADGKSQIINGRYNSYTNMNGRFAFETNYTPDAEIQPIVSVRVQSVSETDKATTVTTTVCKRS